MTDLFAAIDLGSNSFRLLLAGRRGDELVPLEQLKEKVQLLGGFRDGRLQQAAIDRGLGCLDRFAQRVAAVPKDQLWVIGTHALRAANNIESLMAAVEEKLGVSLSVVSGAEEASLIYLGVAHHCAQSGAGQRLVVDIGGGSTELAWGTGGRCEQTASSAVGCVALTDGFFAAGGCRNGEVVEAFRAARAAARGALQQQLETLPDIGPAAEIIGTSGTIESVQAVLTANGWDGQSITREGLQRLVDALLAGKWLVNDGLPGLPPERVDIFPAGVALLSAIFEVLGLNKMDYVHASLQDGVLYRHVASTPSEDLQRKTIKNLGRRYRVDARQAARVRGTAVQFFSDTQAPWWQGDEQSLALLVAAAELHEIGLTVAARHYHRHGAYLLQHADLRGFTAQEQRGVALLVRAHRRALPLAALRGLNEQLGQRLLRLLILLRLAVILHRGHEDADPPNAHISVANNTLLLRFTDGWLERHALSRRELAVEAEQLAAAGWQLELGA
jgi:exopolyphosphatase/guanosine-5'-triphosphate,3'-diphosphate pyrophosphatase